jgi:hypothetical protein
MRQQEAIKMKEYERPIVLTNEELAEGVYAARGDVAYAKDCDSKYMKGVWQPQSSGDGSEGYKKIYGCLGCPAHTASGCGLLTHYESSNLAGSYEVDKGNHKPAWEWNGYKPYDTVTDWTNCGNQVGTDKS